MENLLCEIFDLCILLGYLTPEEHSHLIRIKLAIEHLHDFFCNITATAIISNIILTMPLISIIEHSFICSKLDTTEGSVIDIALHFQNPRNKCLIARNH